MGYSIRTKRFRYTVWIGDYYSTEKPFSEANILAREMYDYQTDPLETVSLIGKKEYAKDEAMMKNYFEEAMNREHNQFVAFSKRANYQKPISTNTSKKERQTGDVE